jgi:hypothetical protein
MFKEDNMSLLLKKNSRTFLAALAVVFGISAAPNASAQDTSDRPVMNKPPQSGKQTSTKPGTKDKMTIEVPILMFVPVEVSTELERKGCWVKFFDKKDFEGDSLLLSGPVNLPTMTGPFGYDWEDKVRSLKIGPKANLTIYDNRNYRDQDKFIGPNKNVPDLSEKMGFFENFRSMMLSCI